MTPCSAYPWTDEFLRITQNGANLSGSADGGGGVAGTVSNPRHVRINFTDSALHPVTLEGDANDTIDAIAMGFNHLGSTGTFTLQRQ